MKIPKKVLFSEHNRRFGYDARHALVVSHCAAELFSTKAMPWAPACGRGALRQNELHWFPRQFQVAGGPVVAAYRACRVILRTGMSCRRRAAC